MGRAGEIIYNLGSSHLSASRFKKKSDLLEFENFELIDLPSANTSEESWFAGLDQTFGEITKSHAFKGEASLILPASIILSKTLRVPKVEISKQRKVVAFELSQKMPFPLEQLVWDFLVIDDDGIEQEILSFAIKPDVIEKLLDIAFKHGVIPTRFTPAPSLDYFSQNLSEESENKDILFLNFGAKSTNLTFINASGYLLRSLNFGGAHLTESISSHFGINIEKAEELKRKISEQEQSANEPDKSISDIQPLQENYLNKYMQEISRSIVTYKRLKKGKSPAELIITGRTVQAKTLLQSLSQSQMLPIKYFDPFKLVTISGHLEGKHQSILPFVSSEILGLAKLLSGDEENNALNLLPEAKLKKLENKKKIPWLFCATLILGLSPLPWFLKLYSTENTLNKQLTSLTSSVKEASLELEKTKSSNKNLGLFVEINRVLDHHLRKQENLSSNVFSLQKFLNELQAILHPDISENTWIDTMEFMPLTMSNNNGILSEKVDSQKLKITGRYLVKLENSLNPSSIDDRKLLLIEESGRRQEKLTQAITEIDHVAKVNQKVFSIEGKGDLYKRQFTYFEFDLLLDLKK